MKKKHIRTFTHVFTLIGHDKVAEQEKSVIRASHEEKKREKLAREAAAAKREFGKHEVHMNTMKRRNPNKRISESYTTHWDWGKRLACKQFHCHI